MPIITKKPLGNKLIKGRDHLLDCTSVWKIAKTDINFNTDVTIIYVTLKDNDSLDDSYAIVALNSEDNPDCRRFRLNRHLPLYGIAASVNGCRLDMGKYQNSGDKYRCSNYLLHRGSLDIHRRKS